MASLSELKKRRNVIKSQLTRFRTFLDKFVQEKAPELPDRLEKCVNLWDSFDKIQSDIEIIDEKELNGKERQNFEDSYYALITRAKNLMSESSQLDHSQISEHIPTASSSVRLPTLELPHFNGEYDRWVEFRDTFKSLIHSSSGLSNIQKFHYLRSCLKGEAAEVIHSLEISDDNYDIGWKLLQERFENKRLIIHKHVKALFELEPLTKDSLVLLRKLSDDVKKNLRALKSLGQPTETWDTFLIYLISNKFDPSTKMEWEKSIVSNSMPNMKQLYDFLSQRCQILETVTGKSANSNRFGNSSDQGYKFRSNKTNSTKSFVSTNQSNTSCPLCKQSHLIYQCQKFLDLPSKSRYSEVKQLKLCLNCLRSNHFTSNCHASGCKTCGKKHNTLLHSESFTAKTYNNELMEQNKSTEHSALTSTNEKIEKTKSTISTHCSYEHSQILLSTALIHAIDKYNQPHEVRVLLDNGSMQNFVTTELCDILGWSKQKINYSISGISQTLTNSAYMTRGKIKSRLNAFNTDTTFLVLDKITDNLPISKFNINELKIPDSITLADHSFSTPAPIEMLLGVSLFYDLLCVGQIRLQQGQPVLQKTKLGWVISGPLYSSVKSKNDNVTVCHLSIDSIGRQLEKFWSIEDYDQRRTLNKEEKECEELFVKSTKRDQNGRFLVRLPTKTAIAELGSSYDIALKRFESLEKKLAGNKDLKIQYADFIREYIQLGHMTKLDEDNLNPPMEKIFYMPHHGVFKNSSETTKLRIVFDGSCKSNTGISLNECLHVGPTLQDDLFTILIRFRQHAVVISADICKMYRQVYVQEDQRNLQRILWRFEPDEPISTYVLNTVTYGTSPAAFLAVRSLRQIGIDKAEDHPQASRMILNDFYVDDLLTGGNSIHNVKQAKADLMQILGEYGFILRKWMSNKQELLEDNDRTSQQTITHFISQNKTAKTLGITWNSERDQLEYAINKINQHNRVTKRIILSAVAQIFDPLGLLGPIVVKAKIMMQQLWQMKLDWDESVPEDIYTSWNNLYSKIDDINRIKVSRHIVQPNSIKMELHCFADASEKAYGCAIYVKSLDSYGNPHINLLCAKSRVAPLKKITIPKLELSAALLTSQLSDKVKKSLTIPINDTFYYTDSTIVLGWINCESSEWKPFVSNRISEIQSLTDIKNWRHCSGSMNPADIISRGSNPNELISNKLWWHGPDFLVKEESTRPNFTHSQDKENLPERKAMKVYHALSNKNIDIFERYSSFLKLQRVTAFILRFKNNSLARLNSTKRNLSHIKVDELKSAMNLLIKLAQSQEFAEEIKTLKEKKCLKKSNKLIALNPFIDKYGIIRVGGRLSNASIPDDHKHPIILPKNHTLTRLIIRHEHHKNLHAGTQALLAILRTRFWPIAGRITVKNVLRKCTTCFRVKPKSYQQLMGDLPESRVTPSRAFSTCGTDFAGPFEIKSGKLKGCKTVKSYMCVFICFVTRAVHLEVVSDLTAESFINCLKRFISRRGKCSDIYSDNGGNFIGTANEINHFKEFINNKKIKESVNDFLSQESISWHFVPARSPHFGGLWESAVKSAKFHIKRVIGSRILSYEEFVTVLVQIECCLNSRPMSPLSDSSDDLNSLTPGHFLIGESFASLPQQDLRGINPNRLRRYQLLTQIIQHFWSRWSTEYLTNLQKRSNWRTLGHQAVKKGALVLIKDENTPPLKWQLGRITELFPGKDNVVRVVNVKTGKGILKRAVMKLCPLPTEEEN